MPLATPGAKIFPKKCMASNAKCFPRVFCGLAHTTESVYSRSNGLEVRCVAATTLAAQVIELEPDGNIPAVRDCVGEPMR